MNNIVEISGAFYSFLTKNLSFDDVVQSELYSAYYYNMFNCKVFQLQYSDDYIVKYYIQNINTGG